VVGLGTAGFVSTICLASNLASTVTGLGTAGYVSTLTLFSTSTGLQGQINSGTSTLSTAIYQGLTSTVIGLGTAGYISSTTGIITTPNLTSTVIGLGTAGYVSTASLFSTSAGLQTTINSGTSSLSTAIYQGLTSTVTGLGTAGYISTLISSFITLSTANLTASSITLFDAQSNNATNNVYVQSSFLYFNNYIVSGANQLQPQFITF
jgi:hypothetical protein